MIETALIVALVVLFIHVTTFEGMINEWIHDVAFNWPAWLKKPIFDCPICMAVWYGALILFIGAHEGALPFYGLFQIILILSAAGGINAVLIYIISADKELTKELKDDE